MPPSGMKINEEQQLPFIGNTPMLSAEPSTINQEQRASIQYHNFPHLPTTVQATNNQIDELSPSTFVGHLRNPNYMGNNHIPVDEVGMQFIMDQRVLPVQLLWDRPNVEPSKRRWNLFDKLNTSPQEHFGSQSSLASIQKPVLDTRQRSGGVLIEPLEPDDSDEERPLRSRRQSRYQLRFVNKVCEAYYTRDQIKADDGNLLMVALFDENNTKITSGPLSSASVEVVALHGDFNDNAQDYWTSEEFSRSVVCPPPGEEASSVLGGDRTLVLAGGEACVGDAFFQRTSFCARTAKFKMGVRLLPSAHEETIQEGISEPFRVIDRHVEELSGIDGATTHKAPPPGFRFQPTDEDLVDYLYHGYDDAKTFSVPVITEVDDIYKFDPWDLPSKAAFGDDEWYFFSQPEPATGGTLERYRAAGSGYWNWKATDQKETAIPLSAGEDKMVGFKKTLVFYTGHAPKGNETSWIMDEYRLSTSSSRLDERVLCKIYNNLRLPVQSTSEQMPRLSQQLPEPEFVSCNHLPPGFRFYPSDEELVCHYLSCKVANVRMAMGFGQLRNPRRLHGFPVHLDMDGDGGRCTLDEIGPLSHLRKLSLHGLENVPASSWAEMAMISSKENLDYLELHWSSSRFMGLRDEINRQQQQRVVEEVIEKLTPPSSIRHLIIEGYFGSRLPNWMMVPATSVFKSLRYLNMDNLSCCTQLPDGLCQLRCLESLDINVAPAIKIVGPEFQSHQVSKLQKIEISYCPNVEVLEGVPSLDSMEIKDGSLETVPEYLTTVSPRYLKLTCSKRLYESLLTGSSLCEYNKISHIKSRTIDYKAEVIAAPPE